MPRHTPRSKVVPIDILKNKKRNEHPKGASERYIGPPLGDGPDDLDGVIEEMQAYARSVRRIDYSIVERIERGERFLHAG